MKCSECNEMGHNKKQCPVYKVDILNINKFFKFYWIDVAFDIVKRERYWLKLCKFPSANRIKSSTSRDGNGHCPPFAIAESKSAQNLN